EGREPHRVGVLDLLEVQEQARGVVAERRLDRSAEARSGRARERTFISEPRGPEIGHALVPESLQIRNHEASFLSICHLVLLLVPECPSVKLGTRAGKGSSTSARFIH